MADFILVRVGALAAMAGGVLWSVKVLICTASGSLWPTKGSDSLFLIAQLLFLAGLAGLYACYKNSLAGSGEARVAFTVSFVGLVASCAGQLGLLSSELERYVVGWGCPVECLGLMALGAASSQSQAKTLPCWSSVPFIIGLLGLFSFPVGNPPGGDLEIYFTVTLRTIFGLSWVLVGYQLFSVKDKEAYSSVQQALDDIRCDVA
jgi:hypothetical protein